MGFNKIREARKAKGWTQRDLADHMGVTQQTIQRYESGSRDIRANALCRLSETLGVTVAYLLGMTAAEDACACCVSVPLIGGPTGDAHTKTVSGGQTYAIPHEAHARWPESFLVRVEGESMNRILPNGCYALVNPCTSIEYDGQPYALQVGESSITIKRAFQTKEGCELRPDSNDPSFQPMVLSDKDPLSSAFTIIGRVVWHCIPVDWSY